MTDYRDNSLTPQEMGWERAYFAFMGELGSKNASRYKVQAQELVKTHKIEMEIGGFLIHYTLDRVGCSFKISKDSGQTYKDKYWVRTGWRKSDKLEYLPYFFAQCQTSVLFDEQ